MAVRKPGVLLEGRQDGILKIGNSRFGRLGRQRSANNTCVHRGELDTHDNICGRQCQQANAVVVTVDYRRPPEHPYPATQDDVMRVLNWIEANRTRLSTKGPLILLGDSAGGTFVASICLRNAAAERPVPIAAQILINPALDVRPGWQTFKHYELAIAGGCPTWPKRARPPTSIVVNELDKLREDGVWMDEKLRAAGVKSVLFEQKGVGHFGDLWCADDARIKPALNFVWPKFGRLVAITSWLKGRKAKQTQYTDCFDERIVLVRRYEITFYKVLTVRNRPIVNLLSNKFSLNAHFV